MYYHIAYVTQDLENDKIYVGVHSTKDLNDGYLGSGSQIKKAIRKKGPKNFKRVIIGRFSTREDAFDFEAEVVSQDFISRGDTYNESTGGQYTRVGIVSTPELIERRVAPLRGIPRTEKVKAAISKANTGKGNGLFKGWHVTPWGEYESAALAAKAYEGEVSPVSVGKWCTVRNDTKIRATSASRSTYLTQQDVGKTYAELGFGFREVT